jgi:hypothetical protein
VSETSFCTHTGVARGGVAVVPETPQPALVTSQGPDRDNHGLGNDAHVGPFHTTWDGDLPDPVAVGAAPSTD